MDSWLAYLKDGVTVGLLVYIWQDAKARTMKTTEKFETDLSKKADKTSAADMEARLIREIENVERRQTRELESLRSDLSGLRRSVENLQADMNTQITGVRSEIHEQFIKLFEVLNK
jgi:uncharacterized protein HemX